MANVHMKLEISSPNKHFPAVDVNQVVVQTVKGEIMILPGHAHLISALEKGNLSYQSHAGSKTLRLGEGVVEVHEDQITVLADEIESIP